MATDLASAIASLDEFELDLAEAHANFLATTGIILSFMGPFAVVSFLIQAIFGGVILGAIGGAIGIGALLTSDELRKRIQEVKNQCDASYYSSSGVCQACGCDATIGYSLLGPVQVKSYPIKKCRHLQKCFL